MTDREVLRSQDGEVLVCEECGMDAAEFHCERCGTCYCSACWSGDAELCASCSAMEGEDDD